MYRVVIYTGEVISTREFREFFVSPKDGKTTMTVTIDVSVASHTVNRIVSCTLDDGDTFSVKSYSLNGNIVTVVLNVDYPWQELEDTIILTVEYTGSAELAIHEPSTDPDDAHLYECSLVQGSSGEIDSLSFTITPNNPGYEDLIPYVTFIEVVDLRSKGEAAIFSGRVLSVSPQMEESGLVYKNIVCEDRLGYLNDSIQPYTPMNTYTVKEFLTLLLDNHNAQVEDYKKMYVGTVSFNTSSGNVTKSLNYQSTWEAITGKLLELGGEIQLYTLNGLLYIDYVTELGTMGDQTIEIAKNMRSLEQDKSPTDIITRLIPLGDYLEEQTGESDEQERLNIASVNGGKIYIDDDDAIAAYGIIAGTVVWEDVTIASNLLEKGKQWLKDQSVNETVSLSAYDLYAAGIDPDVIERYNYYLTYNPLVGVNKWYRVAQKTINVIDPTDVSFTMGDQSTSLSSTVKRTGQDAADAAAAINANLSKTVATLIAGNAIIQYLQATVAEIETLYVDKEYVEQLLAGYATIEYLEANYLQADSAVITDLTAFAANIYTLLGGEGAFGELETAHLTADNVVIDTAVIVNAVAGTILADMITADFIDTNLICVGSEDGSLWIQGSTLWIKDADGNYRIQIGEDGYGDYNLALWDADGNCMWNAAGATEYGINDGAIKDIAVADDANISGYKLNIEEICSIINSDGAYEIDAASVTINGQTLDAWYTTITEEIEGLEGLSFEGLMNVEPWFCLWDSDTEAPPDDDDLTPTQEFTQYFENPDMQEIVTITIDIAMAGYTPSIQSCYLEYEAYYSMIDYSLDGDTVTVRVSAKYPSQDMFSDIVHVVVSYTAETLWVDYDIPATDGMYKWVKWQGYYADGHTEWSIPYCLTDGYLRSTTSVLQTELEVVQGWISERVWYTEIMEAVDTLIETDVWSELNIWLNGIELEVGEMQSEFTDQYERLETQVASIVLTTDSITSRVETTEQQISNLEYAIENLDLDGVQYFETYFCLSDSNTEAPEGEETKDFQARIDLVENQTATITVDITYDDYTPIELSNFSVQGISGCTFSYSISGNTATISVWSPDTEANAYMVFRATYTTWVNHDLTVPDGMYEWIRYLLYYEDGHTEWTTPYCVTDSYLRTQVSLIEQTATSIDERVSSVVSWIGDGFTETASLDTRITQFVTESSAEILLEVSSQYAAVGEAVKNVVNYYKVGESSTEAPDMTRDYSTSRTLGAGETRGYTISTTAPYGAIISWSSDNSNVVFTVEPYWNGGQIQYQLTNMTSSSQTATIIITMLYDCSTEYPDGSPVWVVQLITFADGHVELTEPFCTSGDMSGYATIVYTDAQLKLLADETSASFDLVAEELEILGDSWSASTAEIYAYVDSSMASISLTVSGGIGNGEASITLTSGGKSTVQYIDLSEIRQAFANDWNTSITISAGTVAFTSNTLLVMSDQFTLDEKGNATFSGHLSAPSGTIGGWEIDTYSLYNGTNSMTSTANGTFLGSTSGIRQYTDGDYINITGSVLTNGNADNNKAELSHATLKFTHNGVLLGDYGTEHYVEEPTKFGLVIDAEYACKYIAFGRKETTNAELYTWDYLINHGLDSSVVGYSERHVFYGSARITYSLNVTENVTAGGYASASSFRVYNSDNTITMRLTGSYLHFFDDSGTLIGAMLAKTAGENQLSTIINPDYSHIAWGEYTDLTSSPYQWKYVLEYATADNYFDNMEGMNVFCNTDLHAWTIYPWYETSSSIYFRYGHTSAGNYTGFFGGIAFLDYNNTTKMTYFASGSIDVYTTLDMHNYEIYNQSDIRLKTNLEDTTIDALQVINSIDLKAFDWIETGEHKDMGIIANQLKEVAPELVVEKDGVLGIKQSDLIYYAFKAIQEISEKLGLEYDKAQYVETYSDKEKQQLVDKLAEARKAVECEPEPAPIMTEEA